MRLQLLFLAGLMLVGCSHAPDVVPVASDSPAAPLPPPVAVVSTPEAPRGMPQRPPDGRDPFSKPQQTVAHETPVVPPTSPPSHHPPKPPIKVLNPLNPPVAVAAPDHIDYTVAGIFHSPRGDVALLQGKNGPLLVTPGTRLEGEARVQSIDRGSAEVAVRWGARRYILPLHGAASSTHSNAGALVLQDRPQPRTNRG